MNLSCNLLCRGTFTGLVELNDSPLPTQEQEHTESTLALCIAGIVEVLSCESQYTLYSTAMKTYSFTSSFLFGDSPFRFISTFFSRAATTSWQIPFAPLLLLEHF